MPLPETTQRAIHIGGNCAHGCQFAQTLMAAWVEHVERIVQRVTVSVLVGGAPGVAFKTIPGPESAGARIVIARAQVVETELGVLFLAGKQTGGGCGAAALDYVKE